MFDDIIRKKLSDYVSNPMTSDDPDHVSFSGGINLDSVQLSDDTVPVVPDGAAIFKKPITNQWIYAKLNLPQREILWKVNIVSRSKDKNGEIKDSYDSNPCLKTLAYNNEFPDGKIK